LIIHVGFLEYLSFKQFKLIVKMTRIESGVTIPKGLFTLYLNVKKVTAKIQRSIKKRRKKWGLSFTKNIDDVIITRQKAVNISKVLNNMHFLKTKLTSSRN
jgi:hypothetical protein